MPAACWDDMHIAAQETSLVRAQASPSAEDETAGLHIDSAALGRRDSRALLTAEAPAW